MGLSFSPCSVLCAEPSVFRSWAAPWAENSFTRWTSSHLDDCFQKLQFCVFIARLYNGISEQEICHIDATIA